MIYHHFEKDYPLQHALILKSANQEGLLTMTKWAQLKPEVTDWLTENIGDDGTDWDLLVPGIIRFNSKENVLAFILRWS